MQGYIVTFLVAIICCKVQLLRSWKRSNVVKLYYIVTGSGHMLKDYKARFPVAIKRCKAVLGRSR